jgi:hypothetical protein
MKHVTAESAKVNDAAHAAVDLLRPKAYATRVPTAGRDG